MSGRSPRGLTLVELMLALALGGLVLLSASLLVAGTSEVGERAATAQAMADSMRLPLRTLRDLFRRIEVGTDSQTTFAGGPGGVAFTSWCDTANGWQERCGVVVESRVLDGALAVVVRVDGGSPTRVCGSPDAVQWRYLEDPGNGGRWVTRWGTRLTAPLAVLLVVDGDSLLLRVGERG